MARPRIRYLVIKRQKGGHTLYYWQPSAALRREGFLPRRLAEHSNDLAEAITEAERLNAEVDAWRAGRRPKVVKPNSLPWLVRLYRSDPRYTDLAAKTRRSYDEAILRLEEWSSRAADRPIQQLTRKAIKAYQRALTTRSPHHAKKVLTVLGILLQFAVDEGIIPENPARKLKLKGGNRRQTVWSHEDIETFVEAAQCVGRPSIGLAVLLASNLGQREGDVLRLTWNHYDGGVIRLRQSKAGALVEVPVLPELAEALASTPRVAPTIVVSETTGRPYKEDNFRARFAEIRDAAGLSEGLWFLDLRRTAVVRLGEAGCSVPEIAAVTGHSLKTAAQILEIYLPRNAVMARHAVAKLRDYQARVGTSDRDAGGGVGRMVPRGGIEPPTRGFSVRCSTD